MQSILIYKEGRYRLNINPDDLLLEKIVHFLNSDVGYYQAASFKGDLYDNKINTLHCNTHRLEKKGDIILMSDDCIEDDDERLYYSAEIKRDELARVLDQWIEICKVMPAYVVITRHGDTVTLLGYDSLDEINKVH